MIRLLSLLALLLVAGCQTAPHFAPPGADWQTFQGQMHFSNAEGRSLVGDVVIRRSPSGDDFQLQFSSGPGFPLLKLWQSGAMGRAEGALSGGRWYGKVSKTREQLRRWVRLREVFEQMSPGRTELRGPGWNAVVRYAGAEPQDAEIVFAEGGERFAFHFAP